MAVRTRCLARIDVALGEIDGGIFGHELERAVERGDPGREVSFGDDVAAGHPRQEPAPTMTTMAAAILSHVGMLRPGRTGALGSTRPGAATAELEQDAPAGDALPGVVADQKRLAFGELFGDIGRE